MVNWIKKLLSTKDKNTNEKTSSKLRFISEGGWGTLSKNEIDDIIKLDQLPPAQEGMAEIIYDTKSNFDNIRRQVVKFYNIPQEDIVLDNEGKIYVRGAKLTTDAIRFFLRYDLAICPNCNQSLNSTGVCPNAVSGNWKCSLFSG